MDIKVILIESDPKLGRRGEVIKVSPGYAQNFLFPRKKAKPATPSNLKEFDLEKARFAQEEALKLSQARELAARIEAAPVRLQVQAGEGDKLFGAVTAQDIVESLAARGIASDRKKVQLEEPIKKLGSYRVDFRLHPEVTAKLNLEIVKK